MGFKENYQKLLDRKLEEIVSSGRTPSLLLHSCCAPCSSYVLEYLSRYFEITVFYYNPNISPEAEYRKRTEEIRRLIREMPAENPVHFVEGRYDPERFYEAVKGLEDLPEGGERCRVCFRLRLEEAARKAAELGADYFTTTLTISPLKDAELLNRIGMEAGEALHAVWLPSDFKKRDGENRSVELSEKYGIYRQVYCGCEFSLRMRLQPKTKLTAGQEGTEDEYDGN